MMPQWPIVSHLLNHDGRGELKMAIQKVRGYRPLQHDAGWIEI